MVDPRDPCNAITLDELKALFPVAATLKDINISMPKDIQLFKELEPLPHWPTCDITCPNQTLDFLACECFDLDLTCAKDCMNQDMLFDPRNNCQCVTVNEFKAYFPEQATKKDFYYLGAMLTDPVRRVKYRAPEDAITVNDVVQIVEKPDAWPEC